MQEGLPSHSPGAELPYEATYDLLDLSPEQIDALVRDLEAGSSRDGEPDDFEPWGALAEDLKHLPSLDLPKAHAVLDFLSKSDFWPSRETAAMTLSGLTHAVEQNNPSHDDRLRLSLTWKRLLTDDHELVVDGAFHELDNAMTNGLISSNTTFLLVHELASSYRSKVPEPRWPTGAIQTGPALHGDGFSPYLERVTRPDDLPPSKS